MYLSFHFCPERHSEKMRAYEENLGNRRFEKGDCSFPIKIHFDKSFAFPQKKIMTYNDNLEKKDDLKGKLRKKL